ncbi:MAG TPA: DNA polymerase III subunit alpha [Candidatus Nanopelagicaceae bacterium]|nr:DNA polymerase III subunit alpha [Candidatus Nanopelagicaceae bacterium]
MSSDSFIHLQVASGYSFRYGTATVNSLVERAAEMKFTGLALTDRDGLAGAIRFAQLCKRNGISPILGCDLAIRNDQLPRPKTPAHGGVQVDQRLPRVTLLARGSEGWKSLVRLVSSANARAFDNGERGKPVVDLELISRFSNGLVALHGPYSEIGIALSHRRPDQAEQILQEWQEIFTKNSIAIAAVSHQGPTNGNLLTTAMAARLLRFAKEHGTKAVVSNSVRMLRREDAPVADLLDAIRRLVPLDERHVDRRTAEGFLKSGMEMRTVADEISMAAGERDGSNLLADTRSLGEELLLDPTQVLGLGQIHLPEPEVVGADSISQMSQLLLQRCEAGLNWRYNGVSSARLESGRKRLADELEVVGTLGYASYFLTVADITDMARERGIRVAARGSGAGSFICHVLGISGVDPLAHGLLMERFCSPLRGALPDIDIDVESARRLEIYDQVFARYAPPGSWPTGNARCTAVSMVDTYRARHAIRDTGAALGMPPGEVGLIAKSFPHIRARDLNKSLRELPELRNSSIASANGIQLLLSLAERLDGLPRHLALHPCAVVLSDATLLDRVPTEVSAQGYPMAQFDKDDVEDMGLLKLDILGVRMQSAMAYALTEIKRTDQKEIELDSIDLEDESTFELIRSTRTLGIFQVESPGQRELVGKFGPRNFNDLMIDISLFRPGPVKSDMIMPFLRARHGWSEPQLIHQDLADVLAETEGVVVFHEQVMQLISIIAGVSLAEADECRRALGNRGEIDRIRAWFYPRALERGYSLKVVEQIWQVLHSFGSFGFCKAHAAAFALPTYQSAWLKTHYPAAFIAGLLTHDPGMYPKRLILDEARQLGVEILPITVNESLASYSVERIDSDRYGIRISLSDVDGIATSEVSRILGARPFGDLADFVARAGVSRPIVERLILVGAFDSLHQISVDQSSLMRSSQITRRDLLLHLADLDQWAQLGGGQLLLDLSTPKLVSSGLPEMNQAERVRSELEVLGLDVSCHVMDFYGDFLNALGVVKSRDLMGRKSRSKVLTAGVKVASQTPPVRSGRRVIFLTLDDSTGCVDATFFDDAQGPYAATVFHSWLLLVEGEIRRTGDRGISLRATGCWELTGFYRLWRSSGIEAVWEAMDWAADVEFAAPRRKLVHVSGFKQSPYADIKPAGGEVAGPPRKLWHASLGSSGR